MSRHTWDSTPTRQQADRLLEAYRYAQQDKTQPWILCACFAGYVVERQRQGVRVESRLLGLKPLDLMWNSARKSNFKFSKGRRADDYITTFMRHLSFWNDLYGIPRSVNKKWFTEPVMSLARAIYNEKVYNNLPILADAMEEADCNDRWVLTHLRRQPSPTWSWVLQLIINRIGIDANDCPPTTVTNEAGNWTTYSQDGQVRRGIPSLGVPEFIVGEPPPEFADERPLLRLLPFHTPETS